MDKAEEIFAEGIEDRNVKNNKADESTFCNMSYGRHVHHI